jgi:hypothetical protein
MTKRFGGFEPVRNERRVQDGRSEKHPAETACPECGLVFQDGVWKRAAAVAGRDLKPKLCPACVQIRDGRAGGVVQLGGSFAASHRQDLLNRIRNVEARTLEERPLERIMNIEEKNGQITVSATTEHLVARIGKAIQRDFGGELDLKYAPEDKFATARWRRDA